MKVIKWAPLLLVAVFPYSPLIFVDLLDRDPWGAVLWFWLVGLAAAVALCFTRKGWGARQLARASMLVKLVQIPAYVLWFLLGAATFLFMGPLLAFLVDAMTIFLSGLVGLAAVLRCRKSGILTRKQTILYAILQFLFCIDVISAIFLYRKAKEVSP